MIESINADSKKHKYFPKDRAELLELLKDERIKLDSINTSRVKDFSLLFLC
ncbi:hypothetical protein DCO60_07665 [Helicobacter saguini]|uniref:hypothetical protein n=1 Tax=Helicobacter saguini TaxID=1548018 RepID=UPI000A880BBF|nr:hypothetical protein [Helicobacter saguini]MWV62311.1 hypothetical protein [Helicobacter saguini]MWV71079.1 hypothetical protein [Helicobacter saguini]